MQVVGLMTTVSAGQLRHRPLVRDFRDVTIRHGGDGLQVDLKVTRS
jgi:hypothetical protein